MLLLFLLVMLALGCTSSAGGEARRIGYEELSEEHRLLFEAEMAHAEATILDGLEDISQLSAAAKGLVTGYSAEKTDGSLFVGYEVSCAMADISSETVNVTITMRCAEEGLPMQYIFSGVIKDEEFNTVGRVGGSSGISGEVSQTEYSFTYTYTPEQAGYVNFVLAAVDSAGNMLAFTTPTVRLYEGDAPSFDSIGSDQNVNYDEDNSLSLRMELDSDSAAVGEYITASVTMATQTDPLSCTGVWNLYDAQGAVLDSSSSSEELTTGGEKITLTFPYMPLQAGELQFTIVAEDGAGNRINISDPGLTVADGFYFDVSVNRAAMSIGDTVTGTYRVYGHECESTVYYAGWTCYDANDEDRIVLESTTVVTSRSGVQTFSPRIGGVIEFHAGATCEHFTPSPGLVSFVLVDGLNVSLPLTADTVASGGEIGVNYAVTGGITPYQQISVTGVSTDTATGKIYTIVQQSGETDSGTVTGTAWLGDQVYFLIEVVEYDGNTTRWKSEVIPLTDAPDATAPGLTAGVLRQTVPLGESIGVTYEMSGGSGTVDPDRSYAAWKKAGGTILYSEALSELSGTASYTPQETGEYVCILQLTDGYGQSVSWTSGTITVQEGRLPGDADDDGDVDLDDALLVLRYGADQTVALNTLNADVNADGAVDAQDALLLMQYGAGWHVTLE